MSVKDYPARLTNGYYRVREKWEDASSQLGAFRLLANAMAKADANPGYFVFSNEGEVIYPEPESGIEEAPGESSDVDNSVGNSKKDVDIVVDNTDEETADDTTDSTAGETEGDAGESDEPVESAEPTELEEPQEESPTENPFPDAVEYDYDGNDEPIAYAKLSTLMNIRSGNSLDAEPVTTYKKDILVEILQFCEGNWLRIRCPESETGFAYVSGQEQYLYGVGKKVYTVAAKDNLWKIAEEQIGSGTRYTEIRELNGLTCNVIRVGMKLVLP